MCDGRSGQALKDTLLGRRALKGSGVAGMTGFAVPGLVARGSVSLRLGSRRVESTTEVVMSNASAAAVLKPYQNFLKCVDRTALSCYSPGDP
jgi:hypothetical protein